MTKMVGTHWLVDQLEQRADPPQLPRTLLSPQWGLYQPLTALMAASTLQEELLASKWRIIKAIEATIPALVAAETQRLVSPILVPPLMSSRSGLRLHRGLWPKRAWLPLATSEVCLR